MMKTLSPFLLLISVSRRLRPRLTEVVGSVDVAYDVTFAFVYNAFFPKRVIRTNWAQQLPG